MKDPLERAERALVTLVALHSLAVGLFLTFATEWGARTFGFGAVAPLFFPRQAGAFHFVVAAVYVVERFRYGGVLLLVMTKAAAVSFLGLTVLFAEGSPPIVALSALADAAMGAAVFVVRRGRGLPLAGLSAA
jgi:hypothetical protein